MRNAISSTVIDTGGVENVRGRDGYFLYTTLLSLPKNERDECPI